jgi:hypothetical protein
MKLITEVSNVVKVSEKESGNMYIEGIFSTAENKNINGRIYKKSTLEREVNKLMESVTNKCLWGECPHPEKPDINPDRISHIVESLEWQGNDLIGKAKIIDTPMGNITKTLIREGRIGISSRGLGTVNESDNYVNDDYFLITWDIVTSPSNQTSWVNGIYEGQDFKNPYTSCLDNKNTMSIDEARKEYYKSVWQVLEKIQKSI